MNKIGKNIKTEPKKFVLKTRPVGTKKRFGTNIAEVKDKPKK